MARGTTTDYLTTQCKGTDIIEDALRLIEALKPGQTIGNATETLRAQRVLNSLIKRDQSSGLNLWTLTNGTLFLNEDQESYTFGTDESATTYVKTEIATAASAAASAIVVDSITGISDGDYIGIQLDDDTLQWTTVNGSPSGSTITITDALTDDVAVDNHVYAYTTIMETPNRIVPGSITLELSTGNEIPVRLVSRNDYKQLPTKETTGKANQAYLDRQYNSAILYLWPTADSVQDVLHFTFERQLKDIDTHQNDLDMPAEAILYITKALAAELAPSYGMDLQRLNFFRQDAAMERATFMSFNSENAPIRLEPDESVGFWE